MLPPPRRDPAQTDTARASSLTQRQDQSSAESNNPSKDNTVVPWPSNNTTTSSFSQSYVSSSRGSTPRTQTTETSKVDWAEISNAKPEASNSKAARPAGKSRLWSHVKGWISMSEPSTQALKDHKKSTFQKAGIPLDDPRAGAKLHLPTGEIPEDAIKPTGRGPDPEEIVEKKKRERQQSFGGSRHGPGCGHRHSHSRSHSYSTCSATGSGRSSVKDGSSSSVAPLDTQGSSMSGGGRTTSS